MRVRVGSYILNLGVNEILFLFSGLTLSIFLAYTVFVSTSVLDEYPNTSLLIIVGSIVVWIFTFFYSLD